MVKIRIQERSLNLPFPSETTMFQDNFAISGEPAEIGGHGEILGFVPKTENSYFSVTKESARRGQNMDKVAKPKTCGISILHNEKKFSDQISHKNRQKKPKKVPKTAKNHI